MANKIQYIDNVGGDHIFPVTHERGVLDSTGATLESKLLRPLAEMHVQGAGTTYRSSIRNYNVIPGHTYRFYIRQWSHDNVSGGTTEYMFCIYSYSGETANLILVRKDSQTLADYYDITVPSDADSVLVSGKVDSGTEGIVAIEDITMPDALSSDVNLKLMRPLTEMSITGAGNLYVPVTNYAVMPGHTYRIHFKQWPHSNVTASSGPAYMFIVYSGNESSNTELMRVSKTAELASYYDVTLKDDAVKMVIGGCVNSGELGIVAVEDITSEKVLLDNSVARYGKSQKPTIMEGYRVSKAGVVETSSTWSIWKFPVVPGGHYLLSGRTPTGNDYYYVNWFDGEGNYISHVAQGHTSTYTVMTNREFVAPPAAVFAYINVSNSYTDLFHFYNTGYVDAQKVSDDVTFLNNALGNINVSEVGANVTFDDGYILKTTGAVATSASYNTKYVTIPVGGYKRVRFLGHQYTNPSAWDAGYGFYDSDGQCLQSSGFSRSNTASNSKKEYVVNIPEGAITFKTTVWIASDYNITLVDDFYCFLQNGDTVAEKIVEYDQMKADTIAYRKIAIEPEKNDNKCVNNSGNYVNSTYYNVYIYPVVPGKNYYFSGENPKNLDLYIINWFNSENEYMSRESYKGSTASARSFSDVKITAPEGAAYCYMNVTRKTSATFFMTEEGDVITAQEMADKIEESGEKRNHLRLLCFGNSYSQDILSYVPDILKNMGSPFDISIGILMRSSSNISWHVSYLEDESAKYEFDYYDSNSSAWTRVGTSDATAKTAQWALSNYEWDVIVTHSYHGDTAAERIGWANKFANLIFENVGYNVKLGWVLNELRPSVENYGANKTDQQIIDGYNTMSSKIQEIMDNTPFEMIFVPGTAIQNARTIDTLKELGAYAEQEANTSGYGYLNCADGNHLQEGLPCQIAAYSVILALLDHMGMSAKGILGETSRIDSDWTSGKNIPSPHGDPIGSTDDNCRMGQLCAIMAHKKPFEITDMNPIVNPTW